MADEATHTTEKIYCYDHPSAYQQDNSAMWAALMSGKQESSPAEMAALMNNQNSWNNNPFAYLIWLMAMRWMNWDNNGTSSAENFNSRQIAALQDSVNSNHNSDLTMQAINGNRDAISQMATSMGLSFSQTQQAVGAVKAAIEQVGGQVGYSAEKVINAVNLGDQNIVQQLCSCCCTTQKAIQQMGYENQLATERQTNLLGSKLDTNHAADQLQQAQNQAATIARIDQLSNGIAQGFAQVGFNQQQNTSAIIQAGNANTQRILDQMCANQTQNLRDQIADKDRELQTQTIINRLNGGGCSCS